MKRREFLVNTTAATAAASKATTSGASEAFGGTADALALSAGNPLDPTCIDTRFDCRSISFENPSGGRGDGGKTESGRKGSPSRVIAPGERIVLADIGGPGTIRHIWATTDFSSPSVLRAQRLEVFYDGLSEPSISVPFLDFFGLPHGRVAEYYSALISINEGMGLNSHIPMPFRRSIRIVLSNESDRESFLTFQMDYTLEPATLNPTSYLHATFRRENPTTPRRDFVIAEGLKGPGRFLGCSVGIRVLDKLFWYGEGEVKIYRDGDREFPTDCGTGLEDYVGSAFNLKRHYALYSGAPINIPRAVNAHLNQGEPDFVSFYRWHLPDPVMFLEDLRVTIQQIGWARFKTGQEAEYETYRKRYPLTVDGWQTDPKWLAANVGDGYIASAKTERSDDYCATAYIYCRQPQAVPRFNIEAAVRDVDLLPFEHPFDPTKPDPYG